MISLLKQWKLQKLVRRSSVIKINLGCGSNIQPGYINIDVRTQSGVDLTADMPWCFQHLSHICHEVYLSHVLEHFDQPGKAMRSHHDSVLGVLQGINSMLVPGGLLRIAVPDFRALTALYFEQKIPLYPRLLGRLCGEQNYPENIHRCVFDREFLETCLLQSGFENIESWEPGPLGFAQDASYDEIDGVKTSLNLMAVKKSVL